MASTTNLVEICNFCRAGEFVIFGRFFSCTRKKVSYPKFAESQKPAKLYSTKWRFWPFSETPVFRGHSCGYAAARTSRECATPLTGKPKHWKMFCRNPSTSVAYSDTPAPQVAAQLRPLVYYSGYCVTTRKITRYNEKLYPQVHST